MSIRGWLIAGVAGLLFLAACNNQQPPRVERDYPEPRIRTNPATGERPPELPSLNYPAEDTTDRPEEPVMVESADGPPMPALPPEPVAVSAESSPGEPNAAAPDDVVLPPPPVVADAADAPPAMPPPPVVADSDAGSPNMPPPVMANADDAAPDIPPPPVATDDTAPDVPPPPVVADNQAAPPAMPPPPAAADTEDAPASIAAEFETAQPKRLAEPTTTQSADTGAGLPPAPEAAAPVAPAAADVAPAPAAVPTDIAADTPEPSPAEVSPPPVSNAAPAADTDDTAPPAPDSGTAEPTANRPAPPRPPDTDAQESQVEIAAADAVAAPDAANENQLIRLGRFDVPLQLGFPVSGSNPEGPVRLLVDTAVGDATATLANVIAEPLSRELGIPVQVLGVSAGSEPSAAERLFVARPDANTLMLARLAPLVTDDVVNGARYSGKMLTPIFKLARLEGAASDPDQMILVGPPDLPKARTDRLVEALYQISLEPTVLLAAMRAGSPLAPGGPRAAAEAIDAEYDAVR